MEKFLNDNLQFKPISEDFVLAKVKEYSGDVFPI